MLTPVERIEKVGLDHGTKDLVCLLLHSEDHICLVFVLDLEVNLQLEQIELFEIGHNFLKYFTVQVVILLVRISFNFKLSC